MSEPRKCMLMVIMNFKCNYNSAWTNPMGHQTSLENAGDLLPKFPIKIYVCSNSPGEIILTSNWLSSYIYCLFVVFFPEVECDRQKIVQGLWTGRYKRKIKQNQVRSKRAKLQLKDKIKKKREKEEKCIIFVGSTAHYSIEISAMVAKTKSTNNYATVICYLSLIFIMD